MTTWIKSSYSFSNGNCAEIAAWRTASYSKAGNCAEAGTGERVVGVRDSKQDGNPDRTVLEFSGVSWGKFTTRVKQGLVDNLRVP